MITDDNYKILKSSAISDEIIRDRGYRSIISSEDRESLIALGYKDYQIKPGILMPIYKTDGRNGVSQLRPDNPRKNKIGKEYKYEFPEGSKMVLDCPKFSLKDIDNPKENLWITEGIKKVDSLVSLGLCAIALLGVWNFRGRNDKNGLTILPDWQEIALNERDIFIAFDNDVMIKENVQSALRVLTNWLEDKKANVFWVYLPENEGQKLGVDDYIVKGNGITDLLKLAKLPKTQPLAPKITILDNPPQIINKPLQIINNQAFLATWLWVETQIKEKLNDQGVIEKVNEVKREKLTYILASRQLYGYGAGDIADLNIDVSLKETPKPDKLLSVKSLKKYLSNQLQINPIEIFDQLTDVIDQFVDFDQSLADQSTMCELISCYILTSWFIEAFTSIGYLWISGGYGSGKTQLLLLISDLSYLGETILSGSTLPSMRDLADYGAFLAFDDVENWGNEKTTDIEKRAFLLAGNRKGNSIAIKEQKGKEWLTRYVNTFCPKSFTAIKLPDNVLGSRSIIIPLIRTTNPEKGNSNLKDETTWKHNKSNLIDLLWLLAHNHLPDLLLYERNIAKKTKLIGRDLEPFRGVLTIADWLTDQGKSGLFDRINDLSVAYQTDKIEIGSTDLSYLTIKALNNVYQERKKLETLEILENGKEGFLIDNLAVLNEVITILDDQFGHDENLNRHYNTRRIGRYMAKHRFKAKRTSKTRQWEIGIDYLASRSLAYGIKTMEDSWQIEI